MNNETKNTLLRVTRELIDSKGIEGVSMREVGRHAGLSRTALYRHFENKQSLLAAIVVQNFEVLLADILESADPLTQPKQLLVNLFNVYYQFGYGNSEHYQLMFNTKWDAEQYPELRRVANLVFQKTLEYVTDALKESKTTHHNPKQATAILYAFIHGLVELHLAGHLEVEKGLDNPQLLIDGIIDSIV